MPSPPRDPPEGATGPADTPRHSLQHASKQKKTVAQYVAQQCAAVEKRTRQHIQEALATAATYAQDAKSAALRDAGAQINTATEQLTAAVAETLRDEIQCQVRAAVEGLMEHIDARVGSLIGANVPAETQYPATTQRDRPDETLSVQALVKQLDALQTTSEDNMRAVKAALGAMQTNQSQALTKSSETVQQLLDMYDFVDIDEWDDASTLRCQVEQLVAEPLRDHITEVGATVGCMSKRLDPLESRVMQLSGKFRSRCGDFKAVQKMKRDVPVAVERVRAQKEEIHWLMRDFNEKKKSIMEGYRAMDEKTEELEKRVVALEAQSQVAERVHLLTTNNMVMEVNARALRNDLKHLEEKVARLEMAISRMSQREEAPNEAQEQGDEGHGVGDGNSNQDDAFWNQRGQEFEAEREHARHPTVESVYTPSRSPSPGDENSEWDFGSEQDKYRTIGSRGLWAFQVPASPGGGGHASPPVSPPPKALAGTLTRRFGRRHALARTAALFESEVAEAAAGSPYVNSQRLGRPR